MTVCSPTNASFVAVNSAFPMLVRGQSGSFEGGLIDDLLSGFPMPINLTNWGVYNGNVRGDDDMLLLFVV